MGTTEVTLMQTMSDNERLLFTSEMNSARKNRTIGFVLTFFLGGLGAHRFYLGQTGLGVLYAMFFWTFVPGIIALVELFLIMGRVDRYNESLATATASKVRMLGRPALARPHSLEADDHLRLNIAREAAA
jgi:TM2 domain-containing membrane protein YozV